jgi:DNA mismatch endonuclease (patch repair protein)
MADNVTNEVRSRIMASVRSTGTRPEMVVRRSLHQLGYRYRLHRRDLPGTPDLAFISKRKALFVNGCFWHMHAGCPRAKIPDSNREFWLSKLERNCRRDTESIAALQRLGWDVMTVWECELRDLTSVLDRLSHFLGTGDNSRS